MVSPDKFRCHRVLHVNVRFSAGPSISPSYSWGRNFVTADCMCSCGRLYVFVKAVYVRGIVSVYSIQGLKLRESQPFCKVIYRNLGVSMSTYELVVEGVEPFSIVVC